MAATRKGAGACEPGAFELGSAASSLAKEEKLREVLFLVE